MRRLLVYLAAAALMLQACTVKDSSLPRTEDSRVDTSHFMNAFSDVAKNGTDEMHSLMVLKDGKVIFEHWDTGHGPEEIHILWSGSKTFTATAIGFAAQDGLLGVDDKVVDFFSEDELPAKPSEWLKEMTIYDLLTMSSGFSADYLSAIRAGTVEEPLKTILATPISFEPGTRWAYNSMNAYILSAIITKLTGQKLVDYLAEKLFKPLGIRNYFWDESVEGYNCGGWGLYLTTESLAKMGQFFLNGGTWEGKRILNAEWIKEAMSLQIRQYEGRSDLPLERLEAMSRNDDWNLGYGYQMWRCRNNSARIDGAWGQFSVIIPDKNAVVAITAHAGDNKAVLATVWDDIYPWL